MKRVDQILDYFEKVFKNIRDTFSNPNIKMTSDEKDVSERINFELNRLRTELKDIQSKTLYADRQMAMLRVQIQQLKSDREVLEHKLEQSKKIEVSFPALIKMIQDQLSKNIDNNAWLKAFLVQQGLDATFEFKGVPEGFIRVKNEETSKPYAYLPAIMRGDDVVLPGIVHVPLTFAGAEPPKKTSGLRLPDAVLADADEGVNDGEHNKLLVLDSDDDFRVD